MNAIEKLKRKIKKHLDVRNAPLLTKDNVLDYVTVANGSFSAGKLTLFSIFRDEMYFCSAFFDHYRSIGVEQFLILDDGSKDGTREFLAAQDDCVLLEATLKFGQRIRFRNFEKGYGYTSARAGKKLKCTIPHVFLKDQFGLYVDADEFLLLPPKVNNLKEVVQRLSSSGDVAVIAPMVDFFPEVLSTSGRIPSPPQSSSELFEANPYFDGKPLLDVKADGSFRCIGEFKSAKLFRQLSVQKDHSNVKPRKKKSGVGSRHKVPLLFHSSEIFRTGSHNVNVPVSSEVILTLAHMVFTENLTFKVQRATAWKAHSNGASKYFALGALIEKMSVNNTSLLDSDSRKFESADDLIDAGLMRWPGSG